MRSRHTFQPARALATLSVIAGLLLSGCAASPPIEELLVEIPEQRPIPVIKAEPAPPREPAPEPVATPPEPPTVAVVLTNRSPAYEEVAVELAGHFDDILIYDLADKSQPAEAAFRSINDSEADAVVAIGLTAATASVKLAGPPVVFSQVFNFQDHQLLTADTRGVAAFAPVDAQLGAWKDVEPGLSHVGLVLGPGHESLLEEAEVAADRLGVELSIQVAQSDQEALFYFKRMVQEVDGFWLLPDNRVLSGRVLKEMLAQANRRGVSVLVPSRSMLSIGASVSVSTVAADIAERIRDVVLSVNGSTFHNVPPLTPLTEILVETNDELFKKTTVANRGDFGLRP